MSATATPQHQHQPHHQLQAQPHARDPDLHLHHQPQSPPTTPPPVPKHTVFYAHDSTSSSYQSFPQLLPRSNAQINLPAMNGMNGGANMGGGMPVPTPAGHQAELNYIYSMVEELSRQLADNRRVTEDIVSGLGRVRNKAKTQNLANDDVIDAAAQDINDQEQNLDSLISVLSESLEKARHSRDANAQLLSQYANALASMLKQFHDYKSKHVSDVGAWHRSYREQLDEARRENSALREQIWEMQESAARANDSLRLFRKKYDEDQDRWEKRVDDTALKQELRFWKRMAMPQIPDDDPYWSADDDIVDVAEKERLAQLESRQQEQMMEGQGDEELESQHQQQYSAQMMLGGIAMQREEGLAAGAVPPPRPSSANSSTGSTGP